MKKTVMAKKTVMVKMTDTAIPMMTRMMQGIMRTILLMMTAAPASTRWGMRKSTGMMRVTMTRTTAWRKTVMGMRPDTGKQAAMRAQPD